MSIGGNVGSSNSRTMQPKSPKAGKSPDIALAKRAKQALAKGIQDGGPVTDVKPKSDRSGATGVNDYYSALGYDS